ATTSLTTAATTTKRNCPPSLIGACGAGQSWRAALGLVDQLEAERLRPSIVTFGAAIGVCKISQQWQEGLALLDRLEGHLLEPNAITLNVLASACGNAPWGQCLSLFSELRRRSLTADVRTYTTVVCAHARVHKWQHALQVLSEMRLARCEPNENTYANAITACAEGRQKERALELARRFRERQK
ncbi:unnamed protein product, partial [Prorocentrum cordatum]